MTRFCGAGRLVLRQGGSVSPVEMGNSNESGGGEDCEKDRDRNSAWERMMEPFDQDLEEKDKELEEEMWKEAFGDGSKEGLRAKVVRKGYTPTQKEIDEHMPFHLPYREWCCHCVKGKCHGCPHRAKDKDEKEAEQVPVISVDYMYMSDKQKEGEEKGMPILVAKDRKTKVIRARVVPHKGVDAYAVKILGGIVGSLGYKRVIIKSDREPAIMSLKERVKS